MLRFNISVRNEDGGWDFVTFNRVNTAEEAKIAAAEYSPREWVLIDDRDIEWAAVLRKDARLRDDLRSASSQTVVRLLKAAMSEIQQRFDDEQRSDGDDGGPAPAWRRENQ